MTRRLALLLPWLGLLTGLSPSAASAQQTVFLVRHAEKADDSATDPPLSTDGKKRAESLRDVLKEAGITAIYTSPFRRTKETAQPLATALHLRPEQDPMDDPQTLIEKLREQPGGGNVLIVGHTNTIPKFLEALGYMPAPVLGEDEFDNLFVVAPGEVSRPRVMRLRYKR